MINIIGKTCWFRHSSQIVLLFLLNLSGADEIDEIDEEIVRFQNILAPPLPLPHEKMPL